MCIGIPIQIVLSVPPHLNVLFAKNVFSPGLTRRFAYDSLQTGKLPDQLREKTSEYAADEHGQQSHRQE
jgi:hypothetical protein